MSEHTKTPWNVSTWIEQPNNRTKPMVAARGVTIAITHPAPICREDECEANALHIVHCVNNYERLVAMLEEATTQLEIVHYHDGNEFVGARAKEARTILAALEAEKGGEL